MPRERAAPSRVLVHDDRLALASNGQAETKRQATRANPKIKESSLHALVV